MLSFMPWYGFALTAAVVWGLHYILIDRALTTISPITAYWMPTLIMVLGLPFFSDTLIKDFKAVYVADWTVQLSVAIIAFTSFIASMSLYKAIQLHNPVHASLIEMSYPVFIVIFSYLILKENHFDIPTMIGGGMMIAGGGVIVYHNG